MRSSSTFSVFFLAYTQRAKHGQALESRVRYLSRYRTTIKHAKRNFFKLPTPELVAKQIIAFQISGGAVYSIVP